MDHVVPLAFGGSSHLDNLAAICPRCHARKSLREAAFGRDRARSRSFPPIAERPAPG
jgi:5-methylcytosine-specific restriction endonuclease McrA